MSARNLQEGRSPDIRHVLLHDFKTFSRNDRSSEMSAILFWYTCNRCGHQFNVPATSDFAYGEFIMRSNSGEHWVFLNAFDDPVFTEVADIVDSNPKLQAENKKMVGGLTQSAFSAACDPAPDGSPYRIGWLLRCPKCGGDSLKGWDEEIPPVRVDLPSPAHVEWLSLSMDERRRLIEMVAEEVVTGRS